jgi:hypothetical protein
MVAFNGLFLFGNGLFMLIAPEKRYFPGVATTGLYNRHFVRHIGIIEMFLSIALTLAWCDQRRALERWTPATLWLIAHTLFRLGGDRRHLRPIRHRSGTSPGQSLHWWASR